jgi:hypothetical protein
MVKKVFLTALEKTSPGRMPPALMLGLGWKCGGVDWIRATSVGAKHDRLKELGRRRSALPGGSSKFAQIPNMSRREEGAGASDEGA